jgi:hypothetical protein
MSEQLLDAVAEGLVVRPGDTLLLRLPADMSMDAIARARDAVEPALREKLPGVDVVLVCGVEQIAVRRAEDGADE